MSERADKAVSKKEIFLALLFSVWMGGALISAIYQGYVQKRDCVRSEGWVKGLLWCSSESPRTLQSILFRALIWPLGLLQITRADADNGETSAMTQKEFDQSRVGTIYTCWGVAIRTDRTADSETLSKVLALAQRDDASVQKRHEDFLRFAGIYVGELELKGELDTYYGKACAEPAARMSQAISQGMLR